MSDVNKVNQSGASAERIVGRDLTEINYVEPRATHIERLVAMLEKEIEKHQTRDELIESLEFFETPYAPDGVIGIEAKLRKVGREDTLILALRYKEMFAKFLTRYSLYQAAQELIALCLHKVVFEFDQNVHPNCSDVEISELDKIIAEKVVTPIVEQYASGVFSLNHGIVQGMVYWLADRCFVRWHAA